MNTSCRTRGACEAAVEALTAMRDSRVRLEAEPVWAVSDPSEILYFECLARIQSATGQRISPDRFIPPLERLGLISVFDGHVVNLALKLLRAYPNLSFGVNLSAASAVPDAFWEVTLAEISNTPDLGHRFFVEITETAPVNPEKGHLFITHLKQSGCRVAIDDFGVGHSVRTAMLIKSPDVVKIDRTIMSGIRNGRYSNAVLRKLVASASRWAPQVVVEGVETESDLAVVRSSGAAWAQGFLRKASQYLESDHVFAL